MRSIVVSVAVLAAGCAAATPGDVAGSPSPPMATGTSGATPSPTAEPTERPIRSDDVVATTVENLRVRKEPGTDSEALGLLELGSIAFILDEPIEVDGIAWYPASGLGVPLLSGCVMPPPDRPIACPSWRGWIAGANPDGDPWLKRAAATDCPTADVAGIIGTGYTYRLICFGNRKISFKAYFPELPLGGGLGGTCRAVEENRPSAWLYCGFGFIVTARQTDDFQNGLPLTINPQTDVVMPERGRWLRITGHFDDPAARRCDEAAEGDDIDPIGAVFQCRLQFVATAITPTTAP